MLTIPLHCFLYDKNIFHINFTPSLPFQWKLLVMAKHGELFESKILVYVQPLITRLCPLHVHKHGFIVHNRFITINCWSAIHYDISLQQTLLQQYIVAIYRFVLLDIIPTKSRQNDILARCREDCINISLIYRFNVRQSMQCFADVSAINRENNGEYSSILVCITFVQYCRPVVILSPSQREGQVSSYIHWREVDPEICSWMRRWVLLANVQPAPMYSLWENNASIARSIPFCWLDFSSRLLRQVCKHPNCGFYLWSVFR